MNWLQALVLGAVQGLTEFLPVSSSGHLVLFQTVMGVKGNMLLFDTVLHLGTLIAVCIVLWKDIVAILKRPIQPLTGYLILATVPAVVATLLFGDFFEQSFASTAGVPLAVGFLVTSLLMFLTPVLREGTIPMERTGVGRSLLVGVAQAVSILPSVSRSGSTIFGSLLTGMTREDATRFSFLMSIPAIVGSLVFQAKDVVDIGLSTALAGIGVGPMVLGIVAATLTGWLAVKLVFDAVKRGKLWMFGVYTTVLAVLILLDNFVTHIVF